MNQPRHHQTNIWFFLVRYHNIHLILMENLPDHPSFVWICGLPKILQFLLVAFLQLLETFQPLRNVGGGCFLSDKRRKEKFWKINMRCLYSFSLSWPLPGFPAHGLHQLSLHTPVVPAHEEVWEDSHVSPLRWRPDGEISQWWHGFQHLTVLTSHMQVAWSELCQMSRQWHIMLVCFKFLEEYQIFRNPPYGAKTVQKE